MAEIDLVIRPRDPVFVRDGRPFEAGAGFAFSLPWPLPSTLAGAVRTHIGNSSGFKWTPDEADRILQQVSVAGPLMLAANGHVREAYLRAPADCIVTGVGDAARATRVSPSRHLPDGAGYDLMVDENGGLRQSPVPVPLTDDNDEKPARGYEYWSLSDSVSWLCGEKCEPPDSYLSELPKDARTHVAIDERKGASKEGMLFTTVSICLNNAAVRTRNGRPDPEGEPAARVAILCRVTCDDTLKRRSRAFLTLGGESRVSSIEESDSVWPELPRTIASSCAGKTLLKLQIVTPALFSVGWKPGWLGDDLCGSPPNALELKLRLVSAAVSKHVPVSGWSMKPLAATGEPGPKKARYAVPPGSVYFFEVVEGTLTTDVLDNLWLQPVSDNDQDRRDGFGLAVPGVWDYAR